MSRYELDSTELGPVDVAARVLRDLSVAGLLKVKNMVNRGELPSPPRVGFLLGNEGLLLNPIPKSFTADKRVSRHEGVARALHGVIDEDPNAVVFAPKTVGDGASFSCVLSADWTTISRGDGSGLVKLNPIGVSRTAKALVGCGHVAYLLGSGGDSSVGSYDRRIEVPGTEEVPVVILANRG